MKVDRPFSFGIAPRSIAAMFAVLAFPLFAIVGCSGASVDAGGESDPGQVASSADDLRGTGAGCTQNSQCRSRVCVRHVCRAPSCTDGATNGSETDVDCGGPNCSSCRLGRSCRVARDCASDLCMNAVCTGECQPGALECAGDDLRVCDSSGHWQTTMTCPLGCAGGACAECRPGTTECSGNGVRMCDGSGHWHVAIPCAFGCVAGACTECNPGTTECSGDAVRICDGSGHWQTEIACAGLCVNGMCRACTPGTTECAGNGIRVCDDTGNWLPPRTCTTPCCS